ncbi:MAG: 2-C-methyl-D-erythritol 2,4-cyclodiphosphate synthase, partial [Acidobacteriota bacterium]
MDKLGIVVVAAGSSQRFGRDKLGQLLGGRSVLERAVAAVREPLPGFPCVVVVAPQRVESARGQWDRAGVAVVAGGQARQDSVRAGIEALSLEDDDVAVVHDGARPFVPAADVWAVVEAGRRHGAAVLGAPVADTLKEVTDTGWVVTTRARERVVRSLTPQVFRVDLLRRAWAEAGGGHWTDEAALLEGQGVPVAVVPADPRNLKVTTPHDLELLRGLFPRAVRVGQGIDVHPFAPGRELWLCGVRLAGEVGLTGHSDADVVLHAVTDAILGACGEGDIGVHFPPSDERWRGAASTIFVRHALELAAGRGLQVAHCDVTVLAERPRLAPWRKELLRSLAAVLGVPEGSVSLKATTCEGLG